MAVHLRTRPTMRLMRKSRRRGLMTEVGWKTRCTLLGALSLLAACTSTVPEAEFADVSDLVADRTGETIMWEPTTDIAPDVDARVETLLSEDLTAESAVQIALLNNPGLRATYADLGIGRADLVQAGLMRNPVFDAVFRLPGWAATGLNSTRPRPASWTSGQGKDGQVNVDFGLMFGVLEMFTIPIRQRVAESNLQTGLCCKPDVAEG